MMTRATKPSRRPPATPNGALSSLTPSQLASLKSSFHLLDSDSDGLISAADLTAMLSSLNLPSDLHPYLATIPQANLAAYLTHLSQHLGRIGHPEELLRAFAAFDSKDDGTVDVAEVAEATGVSESAVMELVSGWTVRRWGGGEGFRYREWVDAVCGKEEEEGK